MTALLDTHLLLWACYEPVRLPSAVLDVIERDEQTLLFSAISVWEVAIKAARSSRFAADASEFRNALLGAGYVELPFAGAHAAAVRNLPALHSDPFDRALLVQARIEGVRLATVDRVLERYGDPVDRY